MDFIKEAREVATQVAERKRLLSKIVNSADATIKEEKQIVDNYTKARWAINEALKVTLQKFKKRIEEPLTMSLRSVFKEHDLKFVLDIEVKRNSVECRPLVQDQDKDPYEPKDEMGGSLVDILSVVQRIVLWSLEKPRSRPLLILDEPFTGVGRRKEIQRVGQLLKQIADNGFQIILATHEPRLAKAGDKIHYIEKDPKTGISKIMPVEKIDDDSKVAFWMEDGDG